ncbi:glycosyltransferase family 2 protein [Winogradskyella jejuensis]|uniref:Glycosyltransferase involved in cell wall bisynthesis n=1 Tax=Winogradskyella jejuensis TaxID=1089305 RepID=A0A1M5K9S4_9FLAO|nr:glycosyltransferase [Winogradskyella jejuensis]SHG49340.1 Glycosyltransferase involved in cell wall bisynthesis [Winogradskyella jejuensis]
MLSILIPTYNYNISKLVEEIHEQASEAGIEFEILCKDDASTLFTPENEASVNELSYATYFKTQQNLGRTATRQFLCDKAKYDWLLFLDADVIPKSKTFIKNYMSQIDSGYDAVFGGFAYDTSVKIDTGILRWKYGKTYEEVDAKKRNLKPYELIISANFLIKKSVFSKINTRLDRNGYGLDNYFSALLRAEKTKVHHINNEAFHYGLENNTKYIEKAEEAISTLLWMRDEKKITTHNNKLLKTHSFLKKLRLNYITVLLYKMLNIPIRKNLLSENPNVRLLQVYKLLYISHKDLSK